MRPGRLLFCAALAAVLAAPAPSAEPRPVSGHGSTAEPVSVADPVSVAEAVSVGEPATAAEPDRAAAPAKPGPGSKTAAIILHEGVPRVVFLGQLLTEFVAAFPTATRTPYAGQPDVVRLQVPTEGISALAMGLTPASMTIESIGFNFAGDYEGVKASRRRTAEGIGSGSTVNDLLGTYGRPAEMSPEKRRGTLSPQITPERDAPMRYLYRSTDATITTYFVVEGSQVTRMAMSRPASVERWILKRPGPTPPAAPPGPAHPPAQPGQP